ncbi:MAG: hypothetical protein HY922_11665 [Elusimicrobia bacterium]|nr:hypothetical protein [Elusimicrobiota bacterium]
MTPARFALGLCALAAYAALLCRASASHSGAVSVYGHASYYLILALVLTWLAAAWDSLRSSGLTLRRFWSEHRLSLALALALSIGVFASVSPRFRVLSDETNLLGVSQSMVHWRTAFNPTIADRFYGDMFVLNNELEKRPLLFPFLVSIAHQASGYRYTNPFCVNFLVLFILLSGIIIGVRRLAGFQAAAAAGILTASYPLVSLCAASGGQDLLSAALFCASAAGLYRFMRDPRAESLAFFWATLLLYCHTRYESFLLGALMFAGAVLLRYVRWEHIAARADLYLASPLLLLPLIVQRMLMPRPFEPPANVPTFAWAHFKTFFLKTLQAQWTLADPLNPHAGLLNCVSAAMLLALAFALARRRIDPGPAPRRHFLGIVAACLAVQLSIFWSYYIGDCVHPASARFFLLACVLGALVPVAFHAAFPALFPARALFLLSLASAALYHPVAVSQRHTRSLELIRETEACHRFVLDSVKDDRAFFIYSRPGQITVLERAAADFAWANRHSGEILDGMGRHLYLDVFALQRIEYRTGLSVKDDALGPEFRLETVQETQTTASAYLRISRVRPALK